MSGDRRRPTQGVKRARELDDWFEDPVYHSDAQFDRRDRNDFDRRPSNVDYGADDRYEYEDYEYEYDGDDDEFEEEYDDEDGYDGYEEYEDATNVGRQDDCFRYRASDRDASQEDVFDTLRAKVLARKQRGFVDPPPPPPPVRRRSDGLAGPLTSTPSLQAGDQPLLGDQSDQKKDSVPGVDKSKVLVPPETETPRQRMMKLATATLDQEEVRDAEIDPDYAGLINSALR